MSSEKGAKGSLQSEELVAATPSQRNWRGILIALLVIGCVCGLITFSVFLVTPADKGPRVTGTRFTLEELIDGTFQDPSFTGHWVTDNEIAFEDEQGGLSILQVDTLSVTQHVSTFTYSINNVQKFWFSSLKNYVLVQGLEEKFRGEKRFLISLFATMEISTEHREKVIPTRTSRPELVQFVTWLPDSEALLLVYQNDIFYKRHPNQIVANRITSTGIPGSVFNGVTDLLYKKYILEGDGAIWISPSGSMLCFASFNDTPVHTVGIPIFQEEFPVLKKIKYPKVDSPNPVASLWVVDLDEVSEESPNVIPKSFDLKPPSQVKDQDHYFTGVDWLDDDTIIVIWRNRAHNVSIATLCRSPLWYCDELLIKEESSYKRWAVTEKVPLFGHNETAYVSLAPLVDGTHGTYVHIHQGHINTHHNTPLTYGAYTVYSIIAWDTHQNYVYYIANTVDDPAERHVWRVSDLESDVSRIQECLTCELNYSDPICKHYTPFLRKGNIENIILHCEGPGVPHTILYSLPEADVVYGIQNNSGLKELSAEKAWPQIKNFPLELDGSYIANIRLLQPPELLEEDAYQHPTIISASGAPGSQAINHKWGANFNTFLASNKSWVVVLMDVKGSGGDKLENIFLPAWNLGQSETQDHLSIAQYLSDNFDYVDPIRMGAWGWGHGGYNALRMLSDDRNNILKCNAAINPITDWKLYASYYSEKFMGTEKVVRGGNFRGYEDSTLLTRGNTFRNKSFILFHGSADTDVLLSHSFKLTKELINSGVVFREQIYADEDHDLSGVRMHMYRLFLEYYETCFPPLVLEEGSSLLGG